MLSPMILMALVAIAALVFASIRRIPEGQVYTLRRVGGHTRVMHSGTHFMVPLVEGHEELPLRSAVEFAEELRKGAFRDTGVGLLHGRMKAADKDAATEPVFEQSRASVSKAYGGHAEHDDQHPCHHRSRHSPHQWALPR